MRRRHPSRSPVNRGEGYVKRYDYNCWRVKLRYDSCYHDYECARLESLYIMIGVVCVCVMVETVEVRYESCLTCENVLLWRHTPLFV